MREQDATGPKAPPVNSGGQGPSSFVAKFSAKPDGSYSVIGRPLRFCESSEVKCPKCGYRMRLTVGEGDVLVTCERRVTPRHICGQKVGILGLRGRVCIVVALSAEEFTELQGTGAEAGTLFRRLALVGVPLMPAA